VAVGYYGGHIVTMADQSPKIPTMLHFGELDSSVREAGAAGEYLAYCAEQPWLGGEMNVFPPSSEWLPEPDGATFQFAAGHKPNGKAGSTSVAADFLSGIAPHPGVRSRIGSLRLFPWPRHSTLEAQGKGRSQTSCHPSDYSGCKR
jgi:hypothetical protein